MKKTLLKTLAAGAFVLLASTGAKAQLTTADLAGTWTFTCDFTLVDQDYEGIVIGDSDVKISGSSNLTITNFIVPEIQGDPISWYASFDEATNIIEFNRNYPSENSTLALANANADYPYGNPMYYPSWDVVDANTINVPDFTVVIPNHSNQSTEIVATVKNGLLKKVASEEIVGNINFAGKYYVNTYYQKPDPNDPLGTIGGTAEVEIVVVNGDKENEYYITKFGEYDVPDFSGVFTGVTSVIKATGDGNVLTIYPSYLTVGSTGVILGGDLKPGSTYNPDATITLSYSDGKWSATPCSTWFYDWATNPITYTYEYYWSPLSITSDVTPGGSTPSETPSFVGTFKVSGTKWVYPAEGSPTSEPGSFEFTINSDLEVVEFAGYNLTETEPFTTTIDGNILTFNPDMWDDLLLYEGDDYDISLGNENAYEFETEGVQLSYADGTWSFTGASIWSYSYDTFTSTLQYYWEISSVEKITEGEGDNGNDEGDEMDVFAGLYTVEGTFVDYTSGSPVPSDSEFILQISDEGQILQIAGFDLQEENQEFFGTLEDWGYTIFGTIENNDFIIPATSDSFLSFGNLVLGSAGAAYGEYENGEVVLSYEDGEYTLNSLSVWYHNYSDNTYELRYFWNVTKVTKNGESSDDESGAVEGIEIDSNEPVEFYNLQGVKVANPNKGIYILRQGKKAKKVVIK